MATRARRATSAQVAQCEQNGVTFLYPSSWTCDHEQVEEGVSLSLQSQGLTFAIVGIYQPTQDPDELLDQAVASLREEHAGLEMEELFEGPDIAAAEILFLSLDTVSYCWIRSWYIGKRCVLVYLQTAEPEAKIGKAIFAAICQSLAPIEQDDYHEQGQEPASAKTGDSEPTTSRGCGKPSPPAQAESTG